MTAPVRVKTIRHRWTQMSKHDRRIVRWEVQDIGIPLAAGLAMFVAVFGVTLFAFIAVVVSR